MSPDGVSSPSGPPFSGVSQQMSLPARSHVKGPRCPAVIRALIADDGGQDLLEYALLTALVGLAGLTALNAIGVGIFNFYTTSNSNVNGLWNSPTPSGS
jgi:Flp pilus assembly pilin Flp